MRNDPGSIGFRPATRDDLPMLAEWLNRPHWRQWWGEPHAELEQIRDMVEGRDSTRPYLILIGGEPAGYIQSWFADRHQDAQTLAEHPWLLELENGTVGVDLSLADKEDLSKGIGSAALVAFTRLLLEQGHRRIVIDPDTENQRAIRAYEKAGFRPMPRLAGRAGKSIIMQLESNGQTT